MSKKETELIPEDPENTSESACPAAPCSAFRVRIVKLAVLPPGDEPLFSDRCTNVAIVDEAAGEFVEVEQQSDHAETKLQTIQIESREEWEGIKDAVEILFKEIQ